MRAQSKVEKYASDGTLESAGSGLTVTTGGKISGGAVTDDGTITILGSNATVGTGGEHSLAALGGGSPE